MRQAQCRWQCGRVTKNISRICDDCWKESERLSSNTDEGFKAWAKRSRAKAAREKKPRTAKQKAATDKLIAMRRQKLTKELPVTEL